MDFLSLSTTKFFGPIQMPLLKDGLSAMRDTSVV